MSTIRQFEELLMWQKARELTREIYRNLNTEKFKYLNGLVLDCSRLISSFVAKLKVSNVQGQQYKKIYKKGPSDINKFIMEERPEYKNYYDPEKDAIDFGRYSENQKKKDKID